MTTIFPTTLDALNNPDPNGTLYSNNHSDLHTNANDAIEAIEAKVGVNGSSNTATHDYKLSSVNSTAKAESQANKGIAGGYAPLDSNARVPQDNLPTVIINSQSTGSQNEIGDTTPAPAGSTTTHDDSAKTITITLADGSKTVYSETGIKQYASTNAGGVLISTQILTGTYNVTTHIITYTNGVVVNGVTGGVNNNNSNFAYKNKDNVFTGTNEFDGDIIIKGRVSVPYNPITLSAGIIPVDGKSGNHQKITVNGTSGCTFHMINATPGEYGVTITKTGGTATITTPSYGSKATGGASSTATIGDTTAANSLLGFYEYGTLPTSLVNGIHKFVFDVQEVAVHIMYLGVSTPRA